MRRWRLIPTRGLRGSRFAYGDPKAALVEAEQMSLERGCEVLMVEHTPNGLVRSMATVGKNPPKKKAA